MAQNLIDTLSSLKVSFTSNVSQDCITTTVNDQHEPLHFVTSFNELRRECAS